MDWTVIIEKNRNALMRILGMLVTMASGSGLTSPLRGGRPSLDGRVGVIDEALPPPDALRRPTLKGEVGAAPTLPRHLHRTILRLLRPAEAAARRLVIIAARDVVVTLSPPRKRKPKPTSIFVRNGKGTGIVLPRGVRPEAILPGLAAPRAPRRSFALPLTDRLPGWPQPRRAPVGVTLRISVPGFSEPDRSRDRRRPPLPGDPIDATRLALRLNAVGRALDDLPAAARRFARWRARAAAYPPLRSGGGGPEGRRGRKSLRSIRLWPLRPGRPPGGRRRPTHEIHEVLADLHHFAFAVLERRDSS